MDKVLYDELNKAFPLEKTSYRLNKAKIRTIMKDIYAYSYFAAFDDIVALLRKHKDCNRDELIGFIHLLAQDKLKTCKGNSYYKSTSMANIDWLIEYTEKGFQE